MPRSLSVSRRALLTAGGAGALGVGAAAVLSACGGGNSPAAAGATGGGASSADASSADATSGGASSGGASAGGPSSDVATSAAATGGGQVVAKLADVPVGGTATATVAGKVVVLAQPTAGQVLAFDATCPHQGCPVKPAGAEFKCPCHGSTFSGTGALLTGPARKGLTPVTVAVAGADITLA